MGLHALSGENDLNHPIITMRGLRGVCVEPRAYFPIYNGQ